MADFLGVSTSGGTALDQLVDSYLSTQQPKLDVLNQKTSTLERKRSFFNTLNTRLNSLVSQLDKFTADNAADKFVTRAATSSDSTILTANVSSNAVVGLDSVFVEQIAIRDLLITDQLNLTDNFGSDQFSFTLSVGNKSVDFKIELDSEDTNEDAMKKIVAAVNSNDDLDIKASFVKDTNSTGRISFSSNQTGSENAIVVSGNNKALDKLGLKENKLYSNSGERTIADDSKAGYKKAVIEDLDSKIQVNGINIRRSTNSISDAIDGITLNLLKPQEQGAQEVVINTDINVTEVENLIKPLLTEFNNVLSYLSANKTQQREDPAIGTLQSRLRGIVSESVTSVTGDDAPNFLLEVGITVGSNGTLSLTDSQKLKDFLADNPQKIADLFTSEDSFVAKINNAISNLQGDEGLIRSRSLSISSQIDSTKERTSQLQSRIDQQAVALRKQYTSYLDALYEAQNQLNYLYTMPSSGGGAYDSLLGG